MITFALTPMRNHKGRIQVREYFIFHVNGDRDHAPVHMEGLVDDSLRNAHPKEYAKFKALVDSNDKYLDKARALIDTDVVYYVPEEL
jgi:hypothetical protein